MKKTMTVLVIMIFILLLTACGGHVKSVNVIDVDSEIYAEADIDAAIEKAIKYFKGNFDGCTLVEIHYIGDDFVEEFEFWAEQYDAKQAIVLVSSFDVDSSGGDGSLIPDSRYDDWQWILTRNDSKPWTLQTWGY